MNLLIALGIVAASSVVVVSGWLLLQDPLLDFDLWRARRRDQARAVPEPKALYVDSERIGELPTQSPELTLYVDLDALEA